MIRTLAPPGGWQQFAEANRLEETIWSALPLSNRNGSWKYYTFTSNSSIWDSGLTEPNHLVLMTRQADDGHRTVEELIVETTDTASR